MLTDLRLAELADMFRLMGDPTRLRVLLACLDEPLQVSEIARRAGASPSLVSHHLRLLRAGRIVRAQRQGRNVIYALADDHIRDVLADMADHVTEPETPLARVAPHGKRKRRKVA